MIKEFVEAWERKKGKLRAAFAATPPVGVRDIVRGVVEILGDEFRGPDPMRVTELAYDHGTTAYVIGPKGYWGGYWYVLVDVPTEAALDDYMALASHIVQSIKSMELPVAWAFSNALIMSDNWEERDD